jgi:glycosyltransferase involved in cell wall biosynthesis
VRLVEVGLSWPPETFVALKLRRLAERGLDVRVGSFMPADEPAPRLPGLRLERLPTLGEGLQGLRVRLGALGADVLHFEWLTTASTCLPLLERWDGPVVVSCRGSELPAGATANGRPPAAAIHGVFERASAVHVVAEAKRDEAVAFGLDASKATVIRSGVDVEQFRPAAETRPPGVAFSVISVGWLRWLKGYEYALLAIAELAAEGTPVTFDILGGDPPGEMAEESERARILHTARDLGLEDRVRLHGNVEAARVCGHLQRADALLHASLSEGLPNVVLEAMACALPVVATDVGGTREAVRDGVDGFVIPPRDPHAAAAALRTLWRDAELRERMGSAGRARVEAAFTIERLTDEWVELYERVVRNG